MNLMFSQVKIQTKLINEPFLLFKSNQTISYYYFDVLSYYVKILKQIFIQIGQKYLERLLFFNVFYNLRYNLFIQRKVYKIKCCKNNIVKIFFRFTLNHFFYLKNLFKKNLITNL